MFAREMTTMPVFNHLRDNAGEVKNLGHQVGEVTDDKHDKWLHHTAVVWRRQKACVCVGGGGEGGVYEKKEGLAEPSFKQTARIFSTAMLRTRNEKARDKGTQDAMDEAHNSAADKDDDKRGQAHGKAGADVQLLARGVDPVAQADANAVEHNGRTVVKDGLAKDDGVQRVIDVHFFKNREHCHGVNGGDEGAKDLWCGAREDGMRGQGDVEEGVTQRMARDQL